MARLIACLSAERGGASGLALSTPAPYRIICQLFQFFPELLFSLSDFPFHSPPQLIVPIPSVPVAEEEEQTDDIMASQKSDLIIFGATGFTGERVVRQAIAKQQKEGKNFSFAIAGRSIEKLREVLNRAKKIHGTCQCGAKFVIVWFFKGGGKAATLTAYWPTFPLDFLFPEYFLTDDETIV